MSYPFSYSAIIYDKFDVKANECVYILCSGVSFADSYSQAASIVENYYGDNLIAIKEIRLYEEDEIIHLPNSIIHDFVQNSPKWEFCNCDIDGTILNDYNHWGYREVNSNEAGEPISYENN